MPIPPILIESLGVALLLAVARFGPRLRWQGVVRGWRRVGRRHLLSVLLVGAVTLGVAVVASAIRFPRPNVHDEFSYLLAADTFAHGRLANPPHPLAAHFETFHVLIDPTYASKYPPAQGMLLALGQLAWHPVLGLWIGSTLASMAVCWMLQGWTPGRWALLGGILVATHPLIQLYWGQNFWGGQTTMIGASLVFGALPRLWRRPAAGVALAMGAGAALLANSRPYEGLLACLPAAALMTWRLLELARRPQLAAAARIAVPVAAVLLAAGVWMGYYNWRVTGDASQLPYQLHHRQYGATPVFLFQQQWDVPLYRHRELEDFYTGEAALWYRRQQTLAGLFDTKATILMVLLLKFVHLTWAPALAAGVASWRRRSTRFALLTLAVGAAGSAVVPWLQSHYWAGLVPLLMLLVIEGARRLWLWRRLSNRGGRTLVIGLAALWLLVFGLRLASHESYGRDPFADARAALLARLESLPGEHLVVVRYAPGHDTLREWVYNEADIDRAKVVWAREMSSADNQRLLDYYPARRVWLLEADATPIDIVEHIRQPPHPGAAPREAGQ